MKQLRTIGFCTCMALSVGVQPTAAQGDADVRAALKRYDAKVQQLEKLVRATIADRKKLDKRWEKERAERAAVEESLRDAQDRLAQAEKEHNQLEERLADRGRQIEILRKIASGKKAGDDERDAEIARLTAALERAKRAPRKTTPATGRRLPQAVRQQDNNSRRARNARSSKDVRVYAGPVEVHYSPTGGTKVIVNGQEQRSPQRANPRGRTRGDSTSRSTPPDGARSNPQRQQLLERQKELRDRRIQQQKAERERALDKKKGDPGKRRGRIDL